MEDRVHRREADVLVDAAVPGDVVRVEQLVVVAEVLARGRIEGLRVAGDVVGVRHEIARCIEHGHRVVVDVDQELVARAHGVREVQRRGAIGFDQVGAVIGGSEDSIGAGRDHHDLRHAVHAPGEVAVVVRRQQRDVVEVLVGQVDAEDVARLGLHHLPRRHAADRRVVGRSELVVGTEIAVLDQLAGGMRLAVRPDRIRAQEHLVRWMRCIGLVLVHERRRGVLVLAGVVRRAQDAVGAGQHGDRRPRLDHEVRAVVGRVRDAVGAGVEQRIVGLQRDEHRADAAFRDEVEPVVEELAEEGEPLVERRRQAQVGRLVRNGEHLGVVRGAEHAVQAGARRQLPARRLPGNGDRGGVVGGLVDDQVRDHPRLGVDHRSARLGV